MRPAGGVWTSARELVGDVEMELAKGMLPILRGPLLRRLLEVLFDGKLEAEAMLKVAAARYSSDALGELNALKKGNATVFDAGEWKSAVASRKNDDGTITFLTIDPTRSGFEFVVADKDAKRRLITRDAQHEYVLVEQAAAASTP